MSMWLLGFSCRMTLKAKHSLMIFMLKYIVVFLMFMWGKTAFHFTSMKNLFLVFCITCSTFNMAMTMLIFNSSKLHIYRLFYGILGTQASCKKRVMVDAVTQTENQTSCKCNCYQSETGRHRNWRYRKRWGSRHRYWLGKILQHIPNWVNHSWWKHTCKIFIVSQ